MKKNSCVCDWLCQDTQKKKREGRGWQAGTRTGPAGQGQILVASSVISCRRRRRRRRMRAQTGGGQRWQDWQQR